MKINGLMKKHFLAMLTLSLIGLIGMSAVSANTVKSELPHNPVKVVGQ